MQSRRDSIIEALQNIAFGMVVAFVSQLVWFPIIGKEFTMLDNVLTVLFFTAVSFARQYVIRRHHNAKLKRKMQYEKQKN